MDIKLQKRLKRPADIVIKECLSVKKGERFVIIIDEPCREIGYALFNAAKPVTDPIMVEMLPREIHGEEPPPLIAELMRNCDVFVAPTSHSLTHTQARIQACAHGARGATMPGITADLMIRALDADYGRISALATRASQALTRARRVLITTKLGTRLELSVENRTGDPDTGIINKPKAFSNLPAGEAYVAPVEGKSNGTVVIDGSFAPLGFLKKPVRLKVKHGEIKDVSGNWEIAAIFKKYSRKERTLCELGIGTNYKAAITGNVLEDEKVLGTIHVAFGNNLGFGGKNKACIHLDGIVRKPYVWLDGKPFIENGRLLL